MSDEAEKQEPVITNKRYSELIDECARLDDLFYNEGIQGVPDHVYDAIRRQITLYERTNPSEIDFRSPNLRVGQGVNKVTNVQEALQSELVIAHERPMLSMQNVNDLDDLFKRLEKIYDEYGDNQGVLLEDKLNGVAARVYYTEGMISSVSTRGDGLKGLDITPAGTELVPATIDCPGDTEITGEIVLAPRALEAYNKHRKATGYDPCANELSAVVSLLRCGHHERTLTNKFLRFIAFDVSSSTRVFKNAYSDKHEFMTSCGIPVIGKIRLNKNTYEPIIRQKLSMQGDDRKNKVGYSIDGFVFKVDSSAIRKVIGETSVYPKWCFAYKFEPVTAKAVVCGVSFTVGRTGVVTPVIHIDPTEVLGVLVTKASLANSSKLFKLDVRVGDTVTVYRGGDVIPQIGYVVNRPNTASPRVEYPTHCPCCATELVTSGMLTICKNSNCTEKLTARLAAAFEPGALSMSGSGPGIASKLVANGITNIYELVCIDDTKAAVLLDVNNPNRLKTVPFTVLYSGIKSVRRAGLFLSEFIVALSITGVGPSTALALHLKLQSVEAFLELEDFKIADSLNVINYSHATAKSISDFLKENGHWVREFLKIVPVTANSKCLNRIVKNTAIKDKLFVFSGEFEESRSTLQAYVTQLGGKHAASVTKKTDYFVVGDKASKAKLKSAAKNKTKSLSYAEFKALMQEIE